MFSLDALFCYVDDFCNNFKPQWKTRLLHYEGTKRIRHQVIKKGKKEKKPESIPPIAV